MEFLRTGKELAGLPMSRLTFNPEAAAGFSMTAEGYVLKRINTRNIAVIRL
jgi:hypothetical protein